MQHLSEKFVKTRKAHVFQQNNIVSVVLAFMQVSILITAATLTSGCTTLILTWLCNVLLFHLKLPVCKYTYMELCFQMKKCVQ